MMKKYRSRDWVEAIQFDGTKKCAEEIQGWLGNRFFYKYNRYSHHLICDGICVTKGMWLFLDQFCSNGYECKFMRDDQFRESYEVK
jgi:hypothetical protein